VEIKHFPVACFAPALSDDLLASYTSLIAKCDDAEVKDALESLLRPVAAWWALPESRRKDGQRVQVKHRGKEIAVEIAPLESAHVTALDKDVPWMRELSLLSNERGTGLFDGLRAGELRNAAFHLLWFCKELTLDREPLTVDKLAAAAK
jgi:hypothetical protein